MRTILFLLALLPLLLLFAKNAFPEEIEYRQVVFPSGVSIKAEVADTPGKRERGLMFREKLSMMSGMLFIFSVAAPYRFWMKNVKIPLDIIWLDSNRQIVYIMEDLQPCSVDPCADFGPKGMASLFVIETASGFVRENRLARGMRVKF